MHQVIVWSFMFIFEQIISSTYLNLHNNSSDVYHLCPKVMHGIGDNETKTPFAVICGLILSDVSIRR